MRLRHVGLMLCGFAAVTLLFAGGWMLFAFLTREAQTTQGSEVNRAITPTASEPVPSAPAPAAEPVPAPPTAKSAPPASPVPATEPAAGEPTKKAARLPGKKKRVPRRAEDDDGDDE